MYQLGVRKIKVYMKHKQVHENDKVGNNTFHSRLQQLHPTVRRILEALWYTKNSIINFQANHDISEYVNFYWLIPTTAKVKVVKHVFYICVRLNMYYCIFNIFTPKLVELYKYINQIFNLHGRSACTSRNSYVRTERVLIEK